MEDGSKGEDRLEKDEGRKINRWRRREKLNQYAKMLERREGWRSEEKDDSEQEEDHWEEAEGKEWEKEYVGKEEEFIDVLIVEMEDDLGKIRMSLKREKLVKQKGREQLVQRKRKI